MKKNKYLYIILTIVLVCSLVFIPKETYQNTSKKISKEELINLINIEEEDVTKEFLSWIYDTYGKKVLIKLNESTYSRNIWHELTGNSYYILMDLYQNKYDNKDNIKVINNKNDGIISFVGDISLADNFHIMPKYDERGKGVLGILSEEVVDIMKNSEFMVVNNEFTVSNRGQKIPGKMYTFRAKPERLSIYHEMGVDLLTLANNHVYDFGKDAFYDMLASFKEYQLPYIGAGENIEEAKKPYYLIINGYKIAFVNATRAEKNILTPEATDTEGGVFRCYDPTNLINLIKEVKKDSDYVITLIHWGREDSHELEDVQKETSKLYIDAGSDVIVGTHAHVLQGIEFYRNKPIIYNIGDFIFNDESKDTGIFQIKITDDGILSYYFIPAFQKEEYTYLLKDSERQRLIDNINSWSINSIINSDGEIKEKAQ